MDTKKRIDTAHQLSFDGGVVVEFLQMRQQKRKIILLCYDLLQQICILRPFILVFMFFDQRVYDPSETLHYSL
jgi:hypothetical protein